jgi:hypothetical protein
MINLHAHASKRDLEQLAQRAGGAEILQHHQGLRLRYYHAAVAKLDYNPAAAVRIHNVAGIQSEASRKRERRLAVSVQDQSTAGYTGGPRFRGCALCAGNASQ